MGVGGAQGVSAPGNPRLLARSAQPAFSPTVLRGLIEVRSPHLEELLTALFSATADTSCPSPASGPIVVVSSLLLQEKDEFPGPSKQDVEAAR